MNNYKKNIIYYSSSIIFTSLFLIISTYIWFYVKDFNIYKDIQDKNLYVSENIEFQELNKVSDADLYNINTYNFSVLNTSNQSEEVKISIVPNLLTDNVSNNYVKYMINDNPVKSLNMDGVIYIDNLDIKESKNINLKIWISDTYSGNLNYNGRVIVS